MTDSTRICHISHWPELTFRDHSVSHSDAKAWTGYCPPLTLKAGRFMDHTTAHEANYARIGGRCHIVYLGFDECASIEAGVTSSGLDVLQRMHYDLGMRGVESGDEADDDVPPAGAADVVLAALRAGSQSGLTIADLLRLLKEVVERPIRPELCEETD